VNTSEGSFSLETGADAEALMVDGLRSMSGAERLARAMELSLLVSALALADIRRSNPGMSERACLLQLALRRVPDPAEVLRLVRQEADAQSTGR